jgi:hypothetical protein
MRTDLENEAVEIIESLMEHINWLGGDAYEVEAGDSVLTQASKFIKEHSDPKPEKSIYIDKTMGIYCIKGLPETKVYAKNRRNAKNILRVGLSKISCIKVPSNY